MSEQNVLLDIEKDEDLSDDGDVDKDQMSSTNGVTKELYNILLFLDDGSHPLRVLKEDEQEEKEHDGVGIVKRK
jgi:hypothetical protein